MRTQHTYRKMILIMAGCFTLSGMAALCPSVVLGQEGAKGTPPTGAYEVDAAKVTATRPAAKPQPKTNTGTKANVGAKPSVSPKPDAANERKRFYRTDDPNFLVGTPLQGMRYVQIGVTIWRARPVEARDGDDTAKEIFDGQELAFERIEGYITNGEKFYLGIESLTSGFLPDIGPYLYVINREQYADGKFGRARLIFPTLLTYGGKNLVKPGLPIVLPRAKGDPFIVKRSSSAQVAETFTVILSPWEFQLPKPLGNKAMVLPAELVADWEKQYGGQMHRASLRDGVGQTKTKREQSVGNREIVDSAENSADPLTQADPLPQTVFRGAVRIGSPAIVTLTLQVRD